MSDTSAQMSCISSQIDNANRAMQNFSDSSRETAKALNLAAREYKNLNAIENNAEREKAERIARLERQIAEVGKERGVQPSLGYCNVNIKRNADLKVALTHSKKKAKILEKEPAT